MVSNQAGTTVWRNDNTEPFGDSIPNQDPNNTGTTFEFNMRFPGQYFDKETNVSYNYVRDYDQGTGRYVESDPFGLGGGLNTYAYVRAKPLRLTDPFGLDGEGCTYYYVDPQGRRVCQIVFPTPDVPPELFPITPSPPPGAPEGGLLDRLLVDPLRGVTGILREGPPAPIRRPAGSDSGPRAGICG
jgi:RHS repeat-associated protein